jgi:hypothetical protein
VRDVAVQGKMILHDGRHAEEEEIWGRYRAVQQRYGAQPSNIEATQSQGVIP